MRDHHSRHAALQNKKNAGLRVDVGGGNGCNPFFLAILVLHAQRERDKFGHPHQAKTQRETARNMSTNRHGNKDGPPDLCFLQLFDLLGDGIEPLMTHGFRIRTKQHLLASCARR